VRAPLRAQPAPDRVWRIGVLSSSAGLSTLHEAFRAGMRELGYVEGRNVAYEFRFAAGENERLAALAADLVRARVDVIVTDGNAAVHAAKSATDAIPIVMATSGDPISSGAVRSLSRPGGNVTGLTLLGVELSSKKLELIGAMVPRLATIGMLLNTTNPQAAPLRAETEHAAAARNLHFVPLFAADPRRFPSAFDAAASARVDGIVTMPDAMFWNFRQQIVTLARARHLPAIYSEREFVESGGLMSYGANVPRNFHRAATYVDKILHGARPGDLPVEQPTAFELVLNLGAARALGLDIPQSLMLRADAVIS
jgi:putative ABC transport system substrate-binding protein